jgi:hypothetical protein
VNDDDKPRLPLWVELIIAAAIIGAMCVAIGWKP